MLGDEYVRSEFRAHREVENPMHIVCLLLLFSFGWGFFLGVGGEMEGGDEGRADGNGGRGREERRDVRRN